MFAFIRKHCKQDCVCFYYSYNSMKTYMQQGDTTMVLGPPKHIAVASQAGNVVNWLSYISVSILIFFNIRDYDWSNVWEQSEVLLRDSCPIG